MVDQLVRLTDVQVAESTIFTMTCVGDDVCGMNGRLQSYAGLVKDPIKTL